MDYRMEIFPDYVLKWDGGTIKFRPPDGAVAALLVRRPYRFGDLVNRLQGYYRQTEITFALSSHIPGLLRTSPFRLVKDNNAYRIVERMGATAAGIADNFLEGKLTDEQ